MKKIKTICAIFALVALNFIVSPKALTQIELSDFSSILENPVAGKEVVVRGKIIKRIEGSPDYILSDGTNHMIIHFEDESYSYEPDTMVEVSGIVRLETHHEEEAGHNHPEQEVEIRVNQIQVITANE